MRKALFVTAAVVAVALACGGGAAGHANLASAASSCKNLSVSKIVRKHLRAAHRKVTSRPFSGPQHGTTRYGRCGATRYGLAHFKDQALGYTDQPEVFTRKSGKQWRDRGDTGGDPCGSEVPKAMLRLWNFHC
jgi:hypothetical protein